jgi:hypothetical protein
MSIDSEKQKNGLAFITFNRPEKASRIQRSFRR